MKRLLNAQPALGAAAAVIKRVKCIPYAVAEAAVRDPLPTKAPIVLNVSGGPGTTAAPAATPSLDAPRPRVRRADASGPYATILDAGIYGSGAASRNAIINALGPNRRAAEDAARRADHAATTFGVGSQEHVTAYQAWQQADARERLGHRQYRDLPEEADAWATGSLVHVVLA